MRLLSSTGQPRQTLSNSVKSSTFLTIWSHIQKVQFQLKARCNAHHAILLRLVETQKRWQSYTKTSKSASRRVPSKRKTFPYQNKSRRVGTMSWKNSGSGRWETSTKKFSGPISRRSIKPQTVHSKTSLIATITHLSISQQCTTISPSRLIWLPSTIAKSTPGMQTALEPKKLGNGIPRSKRSLTTSSKTSTKQSRK